MEKNESMKHTVHLGFGEEVGNSISHGVMALLLLFTLPYYSIRAYLQGGALQAAGISIYFICLFFLQYSCYLDYIYNLLLLGWS